MVVAMADSIHTARWLAQFQNQDLFVRVFPSGPHRRIHPQLRSLIGGSHQMRVELAPKMTLLALPLFLVDLLIPAKVRARYLKRQIRHWRPDVVHALETQHAGYLVADAVSYLSSKPEFRLSIWGSDLIWFGTFRQHKARLQRTLALVDSLSVECERDIQIAHTLGFRGEVLRTIPASGGLDLSRVESSGHGSRPSTRRVIVVKGYSGFVGRSLTAIRALETLANELSDYEIHVYSASLKTVNYARRAKKKSGLRLVCHRKHTMSHDEVIELFRRARISISISLSDGFPGSLREAMVSGCFPIESKNSCGYEWAISGRSAIFVDPENETEICAAIKKVLSSDLLVDTAATLNLKLAETRFSSVALKSVVESYYLGKIQRGTTTS